MPKSCFLAYLAGSFHNHMRCGTDMWHKCVRLLYLETHQETRSPDSKWPNGGHLCLHSGIKFYQKNLTFRPITHKRLEIWPHNVLRMYRKPPIGNLGATTFLTLGAPDPPNGGHFEFPKMQFSCNWLKISITIREVRLIFGVIVSDYHA